MSGYPLALISDTLSCFLQRFLCQQAEDGDDPSANWGPTYPFRPPMQRTRTMRTTSPSRMPDSLLGPRLLPRVRNPSNSPHPSVTGPRMTMTIVASLMLLALFSYPMLIHFPQAQLIRLARIRSHASAPGQVPRLPGLPPHLTRTPEDRRNSRRKLLAENRRRLPPWQGK